MVQQIKYLQKSMRYLLFRSEITVRDEGSPTTPPKLDSFTSGEWPEL